MLDSLKSNSSPHLEQSSRKAVLVPNSYKPIRLGAGPAINVPMPGRLLSKGNMGIWQRRLRLTSMKTLRKPQMCILMTSVSALIENSSTPNSQEGHPVIKNFQSESTQMSWVVVSRATGEKNAVSFSSMRCEDRLL